MTASILNTLLALSATFAASPLEPAEAIKAFQIQDGLTIELVASEPEVTDPVAISFDEQGRMFVVEYRDYPNGPPVDEATMSRIKLLEDKDQDGRFETAYVFAENLFYAQGLLAWNGGLLVTSSSSILFLKDTTGDHKADVSETLITIELGKTNPQLRAAHPRLGPDGRIYITNGLGTGNIASVKHPDKKLDVRGMDFRWDPKTGEIEPATGHGQFGNTFDDWGNRFCCSNRNPTIHSILPYRALVRNPFALIGVGYADAAKSGGDAKVYPIAQAATTAYEHQGTHTAACGVTVYTGDLLGPEFAGNVFVCEPTGYLVTRSILKLSGVTFDAERAYPKKEFLASTDTWFRPVSLSNGPDGSLYVVDMYRAVIEHPDYMVSYFPKEYIASLDFRAGSDRGRIYRIRDARRSSRPFTPPKTTDQRLALLSDPNGWRRELGRRLLIEHDKADASAALHRMAVEHKNPLVRVNALWTLDAIGSLDQPSIEQALGDADERVVEHAVRLSATFLSSDDSGVSRLSKHAQSTSARVRYQVALALGESSSEAAIEPLALIAARDAGDHWITSAVLSSVKDRAGAVLDQLLRQSDFVGNASSERIALIEKLAAVVGARGDLPELAKLLRLIALDGTSWWQTATLVGLADGLGRHRGSLGRTSLRALVGKPPANIAGPAELVGRLLERTIATVSDSSRPVHDRAAAVQLLGHQPFDRAQDMFRSLLAPTQPIEVQLGAVQAMQTVGDDRAADIVIERWAELGPEVRSAARDFLLRRPSTTLKLLEAMVAGAVPASVMPLDQRNRLLKGNGKAKELAESLFGGEVSANRKEVVEKYKSAITLASDSGKGEQVYKRLCANCHKINGQGHEVGPDISDVRNKTKETLLYDILDPNRAVEPRWVEYTVVATDGRVLNGLLVSQSAASIVLRRAEGKEDIIARSEIDSLRASGKSLMPDGVEKDFSVQEVADLLEFLKRQK